jgi:hypothetical protein
VPKITIYIPQAVKSEMNVVAGHRPNWSAVAQKAFILEARRLGKLYGVRLKKSPRGREG